VSLVWAGAGGAGHADPSQGHPQTKASALKALL